MADSVAQSVKSLKKNLEELDTQLLKEQNAAKKLGEMLQTAMKDAGVSVDDFVKAVRNKMNSATKANKISLVLELTDAKGKPLTADSIQKQIDRLTNTGKDPIRLNELKDLQKIMGDPTKFYYELMGIVNKMGGSKKSNASSEWREMTRLNNQLKKSILDTRNAIDQQTESIRRQKSELSRLQSLLQRQKNGIVGIDYKSEESKTRAIAKTNAQIKKTEENIRAAEQEVDRLNKKLGQTESQTQKVEQNTKRTKKSLSDMLPTLRRLASAFGVAFSVQGLVQFGKKLVETRGEFELQQVALRSILQNKQVADEIWNKTMQQALQSPFRAMQLTKYTKQLAAYRIETEKLFDTTKMLADVSAGLGVDMQRLILAYGQVKAANYLRASEIRQFTEAGVNVLGELSTYFSKTRGEMVSTAQVMDMVQKRMVTFQDVEAIFKRMTDEGGVFYNMQYIQSQTVKGQINKLHDAYDQMLNSIGKGNQGAIRDLVAAANSIVQNWRYWAAAIKSIAFGALIASISKLAVMMSGVSVAGMAAGKGMTKFAGGVKALGVALKGNWLTLAIGAVVALGAELYNLNKRMRDVNAEIDEQNLGLYETKERLEGYRDTIERNNKALAKSTGQEESLKKRREENAEILAKLKNDYPQLAEGMEIQKNGVIDLTKALKEENEELERQITLNTMMKQTSIFDKGFTEDAKNLAEHYMKMQRSVIDARAQARSVMIQLQQQGRTDEEQYAVLERISKINPDNIKESVKALENLAYSMPKLTIGKKNDIILNYYDNYIKKFADWKNEVPEQKLKKELDKLGSTLGYYLEEAVEKFYGDELHESGLDAMTWYALNADRIQRDVENGVNDFYRTVRESLEKNGAAQGPGMKEFFNEWYQETFITPLRNAYTTALGIVSGMDMTKPPFALLGQVDVFAKGPKKGEEPLITETPEEKKAKVDSAWRRRIQLLEEMKRRYDELSKAAYGYAKSEMIVRQAFDDVRDANGNVIEKGAFSTIFAGTGITMDQIDFTSMEGMFKSMRLALQQAKGISDAVRDEIMKKIDSYEAQITINAKVKIREDFDKEMEKMFSDYELTLDLQKVNLPKKELEEIFGFDLTSTDDIRKAVDRFYNRQMALGADPTDLIKQVEGYYKKLDDMDRKSLLDRLKMYTEYLTEGRDKAVQIHLDELNKMADLDELYAKGYYTKTQYDNILGKIRKETDEKLSKNEWQQFKESDYYVTMFEDLGNVATGSIDLMLQQLKNLKSRLKDLDPTQVKEIVKAIENLEKTRRARSPFKTFLDDLKTLRKWRKTGNRQSELDYLIPKAEEQERTLKGLEEIAAQYEKEYDDIVHGKKEGNESLVKVQWDDATEAVNKAKEELKQTKDVIDEINTANNEGYAAWMRTYQGFARGAQYFSDMANTAGTIATEMMDMFDGVSNASKQLAHDIADIASNTAALGGDIAKAIASEGTDVGSMIDGLVRTWNIIKGASSASEVNINRIVERETIRLENLERSLERVKRARDKAWDTVTVVQNEKEVEQAINDQIAAYDALIAAERSRKNPNDDTLRQWKNEREQLYEQLEEEREELLKKFGGIGESDYLSASEGFVDAWKSAFLETGDGLQGLEDHFDEFMQDWFTKQATMRVAGNMLEPLFRQIDAAVDRYGTGGTDAMLSEIARVREMAAAIFPDLSLALEDLAGMFGVGGEGSLSGLAAGIQGMTEEQANILEAYWNSVRMYTASIDQNVAMIASALGVGGNSPSTNPQLQQLQLIAASVQATHQLLQSTSRSGHPMGGYGFKIFND